jgi:Ca2+-transporting ATPase
MMRLPARKADTGVAMDERGTQIANEAADIVLLDDSITTIVVAIRWRRAIFGSIRKFTD